jgi:hypothetical protein
MYEMDDKTGKIIHVNYKNKLCIFCIVQVRYKVEISTVYYDIIYALYGGTRWRSWLRHCATSWKVAGFIPDGIKIFH